MKTSRSKATVSRKKAKRAARPTSHTLRMAITELREQTLIVAAKTARCLDVAASATEDGEAFYLLLVETRDAANRAREQARALDDAAAGRQAGEVH